MDHRDCITLLYMATVDVSIGCYNWTTSVDVNECNATTDHGGCDHYCNNINGGYYCSCLSGYRLNSTNNKSCEGR